jgi:hypothetical protein
MITYRTQIRKLKKKGGYMEKLIMDMDVKALPSGNAAKMPEKKKNDEFRGLMKNITANQSDSDRTDRAASGSNKNASEKGGTVMSGKPEEAGRMSEIAAQMIIQNRTEVPEEEVPEVETPTAEESIAAIAENIAIVPAVDVGTATVEEIREDAEKTFFAEDTGGMETAVPEKQAFAGVASDQAWKDAGEQSDTIEKTAVSRHSAEKERPEKVLSSKTEETDVPSVPDADRERPENGLAEFPQVSDKTAKEDAPADRGGGIAGIVAGEQNGAEKAQPAAVGEEISKAGEIRSNAGNRKKEPEEVRSEKYGKEKEESGTPAALHKPTEHHQYAESGKTEHRSAGQGMPKEKENEDDVRVLTQDGRIGNEILTRTQFSEIRSADEPVTKAELTTSPQTISEDVTAFLKTHLPKRNGSIDLVLNPANLGKITIRVIYDSNGASVGIHAAHPETHRLLVKDAERMGQILRDTTGDETKVIVAQPEETSSEAETDTEARSQNRREADENQDDRRQKQNNSDRFLNMMRLKMI